MSTGILLPQAPPAKPAVGPSAPPPLSAPEADARLRTALAEEERATRSVVLLFLEIARRRLYRTLGHPTLQHYAFEGLGLAESRAKYFLRLARDLEDLPAIREALESGRLGWTHAVQVARVATPETEIEWVKQAETSSRRELERKIKRARQRTRAQAGPAAHVAELPLLPVADAVEAEPVPAAAVDVTFHLSPSQYARFQALQEKLRKARAVPRGWSREEVLLAAYEELLGGEKDEQPAEVSRLTPEQPPAPAEVSRLTPPPRWQVVVHRCEACGRAAVAGPDGESRTLGRAETECIACDAIVVQKDGTSRQGIPPRRRRQVMSRDGHRCARCGATRFLEIHHRRARADGGSDAPENLITLCSACHALAHEMGDAGG